jgi:iron complex outermembrane receptor protein
MTVSTFTWIRSSIALAVVLTSSVALAQSTTVASATSAAEGNQLGEIIVTAQKREQSIQDVGLTIDVVSAESLQRQGVLSVGDLDKVVPGFDVQTNGDGTPIYSLRGVNFNAQNWAVSPTVAISIDQAPIPYAVMSEGSILDLERVEVLKGPQGTLYGQNATGGTVNLIAAKPTDTLHYGTEIGYGRFDTVEFQGFISGPLSDTVKSRAAISVVDSGPWQYSATRPDDMVGDQHKLAGRWLLDWQASEKLHVTTNINGWVDNSDTQQPQLVNYRPANPAFVYAPIAAAGAMNPNPLVNVGNDRRADWNPDFPTSRHNTFYQGVLRADYDLSPDLQLTSLTDYGSVSINAFYNGSGYPYPVQDMHWLGFIHSISQEVRLSGRIPDSGVHFIVGANYAHDTSHELDHWVDPLNSATLPAGFTLFDAITDQTSRVYAAFTSVDWDITHKLSLSAGVRYTNSSQVATSCSHDVDGKAAAFFTGLQDSLRAGEGLPPETPIPVGGCFSTGPAPYFLPYSAPVTLNENNVPWRTNLVYKFTPDLSVYGTVSRGFKEGAFPSKAASSYLTYFPVKQEELTDYEAGSRLRLFDRTLSINGAVYYYDYKNKQLVTSFNDPQFGLVSSTANIPKAFVRGFDIDATWLPVQALTLKTAVTYADSRSGPYPDFTNTPTPINDDGHSFNLAPKWTSVSDAEYRFPVSSDRTAFFGASETYHSSTYSDLAHSPSAFIAPYAVTDLRAGLSFVNGLEVMVWGKNVTNKYYWNLAYGQADSTVRYANMPATFGITARYQY